MKSQSRSKSKARSQTGTSEKEHFFDNILDIDINKPKTAFNLFIRDISLKQENKGLNITELSKQFSEKFKRLSDREKRKYDELKDKDKERYENNLRLVKMYLVDPDKLKNSSTAYSLFKDAFIYEEINEKDAMKKSIGKDHYG